MVPQDVGAMKEERDVEVKEERH
jgi:hypothetical protein